MTYYYVRRVGDNQGYLSHANIANHKYIAKINTANGIRYFYSQDELDAYREKNTRKRVANLVDKYVTGNSARKLKSETFMPMIQETDPRKRAALRRIYNTADKKRSKSVLGRVENTAESVNKKYWNFRDRLDNNLSKFKKKAVNKKIRRENRMG